MFDTPQRSRREATSLAEGPDAPVSYLRLVEDDTYADWDAAYLDNVGRLYRLMYSKVGNRPDAEDLTAEVFKAALGPMRLSLPVTSIDPETDIAALDDTPDPNDGGEARRKAGQILAALPERYRRILE